MQNLLQDEPTIEIGKAKMTKELSGQIGIISTPFEMFGINTLEEFKEVVGDAASEIILINEKELIENQSKLKPRTQSYLMNENAFEAAKAHNNQLVLENRLLKSEFILKELFANRDRNSKFNLVVSLSDKCAVFQQPWGYRNAHITLEGDKVTVIGTF